jgi:predicted DNA-binding transcriptional regulator AlpA
MDFLRIPDILKFLGISRSTFLRLVATGKFQKPVRIGSNTYWYQKDLDDYVMSLARQREPTPTTVA